MGFWHSFGTADWGEPLGSRQDTIGTLANWNCLGAVTVRRSCEACCHGNARALSHRNGRHGCSSKEPDRVLEHGILALIVILGAQVFDFGLGEIQLSLREFDDGGEPEIVTALSEV